MLLGLWLEVLLQSTASGDGCSVSDFTLHIECKGCATNLLPTDLNLPVSGVAALLVIVFLNLRTPEGSLSEKLGRMDWM